MTEKIENARFYDVIFVVVNIGKASRVLEEAKKCGITGGTIMHGSGTVSSTLLRTIGFYEVKKEILFMVCAREKTQAAIEHISSLFHFELPNRGILFTSPVSHLLGTHGERLHLHEQGAHPLMADHEVFFTIVAAGSGDEVVEAAAAAGARGGTLFHGTGAFADQCRKAFGIELDSGKDIIMNLVSADVASAVEAAIAERMQLDVPGNGFLFSFDAENVHGVR
ncbi:hypothetical protein [Trichococcus ilyis]|uniref:Nitrogen regulatory protein P-II family n=1 Tax=Trichococcus ilyis TaxID=640938 RepID=A0A143YT11_9LACT|nr:hypothetical protein [Trichococcus ilyis]CZQ95178.1 Hypothetical protein TR210_1275 [Trichococcus ilyis]SEJ08345.1 nitrogen regulatory protein P-II family [Trichococcus ilyis]